MSLHYAVKQNCFFVWKF